MTREDWEVIEQVEKALQAILAFLREIDARITALENGRTGTDA